jgi:GNAT superfamily N-acetyltransferase
MIVRPATLSDAPNLAALLNEIIAIGGTTAHETPFTASVFADHYLTGSDAVCCHMAVVDDEPIEFQVLGVYPALPVGWLDIGTFVRPATRKMGAGSALYAATLLAVQRRGAATLNATIRTDNASGLAYYSRIGFNDYAFDADYCLKDGRRVGRISKRYDL